WLLLLLGIHCIGDYGELFVPGSQRRPTHDLPTRKTNRVGVENLRTFRPPMTTFEMNRSRLAGLNDHRHGDLAVSVCAGDYPVLPNRQFNSRRSFDEFSAVVTHSFDEFSPIRGINLVIRIPATVWAVVKIRCGIERRKHLQRS